MKTILTKFLVLSGVTLLMLSSCKKDGVLVTSNGGTPGALTASSTTPALNKNSLTDPTAVVTFTFTQPTYGFNAAVTNTLQIDAANDNWAKPMSVTLGTKVLTQSYATADFNNLLLKLGLTGGVTTTVKVRIASAISSSITPVYSNVVTLTVTPFNLASWLYVTGAFSNWVNPGAAEDSLLSATGNGIYVGIINFTAGNNQFLILPAKNWNHKYATSGSSTPSTTVSLDAGNNLNAPTAAGQYLVTFNLNTGTISFALADYYSVIGDAAQGWSTDVPMKYINDGNGNWAVTLPLVSTGSFKVRRNFDWTNSWGVPKSGSAGFGVANTLNNSSNNNITIAASRTYTVTFNAPATAFGSPALATTTYTVQ
jgi:hypothetical protein